MVSDVMGEVLDLLASLITARNLTVLAPVGDLCHEHVLADRQRFKQVLMNIVSNAIKYNRDGGEIRLTCAMRPDGFFAMTISDTGIGMSPEHLDRLFTDFDRLGRESTGEEGTGIGLALSRRLVHLMNGRVEVESILGARSSFTVLLPLADNPVLPLDLQDPPLAAASIESTADSAPVPEVRIIYIEDNLANVRLIERIAARREGVAVIHAVQGRLGLELVSSSRPDLILLDLHLPDISGEEVLRRLRAESATSEVPVVIVSADASTGQIQRLLEMGASGYLTKPFNIADLMIWFDRAQGIERD
jgi:CheY-like chemotaxis protein